MTMSEMEKEGERKKVALLFSKNEFLHKQLSEAIAEKKKADTKTEQLQQVLLESDDLLKETQERLQEKEEQKRSVEETYKKQLAIEKSTASQFKKQVEDDAQVIVRLNKEIESVRARLHKDVVLQKDAKITELIENIKRANAHIHYQEQEQKKAAVLHVKEKDVLLQKMRIHQQETQHLRQALAQHMDVMKKLHTELGLKEQTIAEQEKKIQDVTAHAKKIDAHMRVMGQTHALAFQKKEDEQKDLLLKLRLVEQKQDKTTTQGQLQTIAQLRRELQMKEELLAKATLENERLREGAPFTKTDVHSTLLHQDDPYIHEEVTAMIKMAKEHGDTPDRIKRSLLNAGYKNHIIDTCLKRIEIEK